MPKRLLTKAGEKILNLSIFQTIRGKLLTGFISMALAIAIAFSIGSIIIGFLNGKQQSTERLESVAALKDLEINTYIDSLQNDVNFLLNEAYVLDRVQNVLMLGNSDRYYEFYFIALEKLFHRFITDSQTMNELFLINLKGRVVLTSNPDRLDNQYEEQEFFQNGLNTAYTSITLDPLNPDKEIVVAVTPIINLDGELVGVLAGSSDLESISEILKENTGLGNTGKAYLVNQEGRILNGLEIVGDQNNQGDQILLVQGVTRVIRDQNKGSDIYNDLQGEKVIGIYRWIPALEVGLLVEQDLTEAFSSVLMLLTVNLILSLIAVIVIVIAGFYITRSIAEPLISLSDTAKKITNGDLNQTANMVNRQDEIGILAKTFNSMTAQLRTLINDLEERVRDRTKALQKRATQLEISSQVSREITSILDIDQLLSQVVALIKDAFGYAFVHIYLLDQNKEQLILRASSEFGRIGPQIMKMTQRGLNVKAVLENKAIVINETDSEPAYMANTKLVEIHSEVVIPLRIENKVIGTLDVNSTRSGVFTEEEVLVLQSLADQIAIAIHNANLYKQSQRLAILEERNRLARDMHDSVTQSTYSMGLLIEGWNQMIANGEDVNAHDHLNRMAEINQQILREMRVLIHELKPPVLEQEGLLNAIQQRLDAVESRFGINVRLITDDLISFPEMVEEELYRITLEALNNSLKHSEADTLTVQFKNNQQEIILEISDNGKGFDPKIISHCGKQGLENMKTRAEKINGIFEIHSGLQKGTTILVRLPQK